MHTSFFCEYVWLDGCQPVAKLRSKARIILSQNRDLVLEDIPTWNFDGSSTEQAQGNDSDCLLKPVCLIKDPLRAHEGYIVLCEVMNAQGTPHVSNTRALLRKVLENMDSAELDPWVGFEQEYTMFQNNRPLGWPEHGYPAPQGPYYCGVGSAQIFGRPLAEEHAQACLDAGLLYYGLNAEVMPGQWEFQIGYRGDHDESPDAINVCDHLWLARWLLHRLSEEENIHISLDNKPISGDWNGAGLHTNYSTNLTRDPSHGRETIDTYIRRLSEKHSEHIAVYGDKLAERLTGKHETCHVDQFRAGAGDRGSSIRIPKHVEEKGYGYLEDRRPGANADPYLVAARIIATTVGVSDEKWKTLS